jgi:hypothetical protein
VERRLLDRHLSQYPVVQVNRADTAAVIDDPILGSARKALKFTVHIRPRPDVFDVS